VSERGRIRRIRSRGAGRSVGDEVGDRGVGIGLLGRVGGGLRELGGPFNE
jgi:hypothetical protein